MYICHFFVCKHIFSTRHKNFLSAYFSTNTFLPIMDFTNHSNHFMPLVSFYTLRRFQKTFGFLMFSEGIERGQ